jgi:hypothetical protein
MVFDEFDDDIPGRSDDSGDKHMDDTEPAPPTPKRGPGRPRKHPVATAKVPNPPRKGAGQPRV